MMMGGNQVFVRGPVYLNVTLAYARNRDTELNNNYYYNYYYYYAHY